MAEGGEELEAERNRSDDTQCPVNWDDRNTLVFREVRQSGSVSLTDGYQHVDIRSNRYCQSNVSDEDGQEEHEAVVTITWGGFLDSRTCFSTCTIRVDDEKVNVTSMILNKMCEESFRTLRHFAVMLFREYRGRIMTLRKHPLTFDIVHMNLTEFEYLQDNVSVLERNFKNLFCEDMHISFTLDLRIHIAGTTGEEDNVCTYTYPEMVYVPGIATFRKLCSQGRHHLMELNDSLNDKNLEQTGDITAYELEQLQQQLLLERESIDAAYKVRKAQNEEMMTSIKMLLNVEKRKHSLDNLSQQLEDSHISLRKSRDSGDGAELPLSRENTNQHKQEPSIERSVHKSVHLSQADKYSSEQSDRQRQVVSEVSVRERVEEQGSVQYTKMMKGKGENLAKPQSVHLSQTDKYSCEQSDRQRQVVSEVSVREMVEQQGSVQYTKMMKERSENLAKPQTSNEIKKKSKSQRRNAKAERSARREGMKHPVEPLDTVEVGASGGIQQDLSSTEPRAHSEEMGKTDSEVQNSNRVGNNKNVVQKATGLDTVVCFDTSGSCKDWYEEYGVQEMKEIALELLKGIERISSLHGLEENVGIVAYGGGSWIKHQPSSDYARVREIVLGLHLNEKTSICESLQVSLDFLKEKGEVHQVGRSHQVEPRLIVITNYNISEDAFQDAVDEKERLIRILSNVQSRNVAEGSVRWVPAGDADQRYLHTLAKQTSGGYIVKKDINRLCSYQQTKITTFKILGFIETEWQSLTGSENMKADFLVDMFASHLEEGERYDVERNVKRAIEVLFDNQRERPNHHRERLELPPLGSKVVRGKDWMYENLDSEGSGTVIGHSEGFVLVAWDSGNSGKYRYGAFDAFDVKVITDPPGMNISDYVISVGCEVQRGPDWDEKFGNEDGGPGGTGVVIASAIDETVQVQWHRNGYISTYKVGEDDKVEVILRESTESPKEASGSDKNDTNGSLQGKEESLHEPSKGDLATWSEFVTKEPKRSKDNLREKVERPKDTTLTDRTPHVQWKGNTINDPRKSKDKGTHGLRWSKDSIQSETPKSVRAAENPSGANFNGSHLTSTTRSRDAGKVSDDIWIWNWEESNDQWRTYSVENNLKLERCFDRRRDGSCLLRRENQSYRVLFKEMEEKCIENNSRRKVQRRKITKEK